MHLPRSSRARLIAVVAAIGAVCAALLPATAAQAETRSGDVTVSLPSTIVLDGRAIPVTVSSDALTGYFDKVYVWLYNGADMQGIDQVQPNKPVTLSSLLVKPGSIIARGSAATTYCSVYSSYPCSLDSDFRWYQPVSGLTYPDSVPATAKWGSRIALAATNDGTRTTWTATAEHYADYSWEPWSGATVTIGGTTVTTDAEGVGVWVEPTAELHSLTATAAESADVWSSVSTAVTPVQHLAPAPTTKPAPAKPSPAKPAPAKPAKPGHVKATASASKAAAAVKKGIPSVRKVVALSKRNDVNHLLGKKNGYSSAAVLYDRRTSCSDGPGVDCGATIEKFTSTAKAKARAKHIQKLLKRYSFLGTEYDTVHGHFLLRVTDDLTRSQAAAYRRAFAKSF